MNEHPKLDIRAMRATNEWQTFKTIAEGRHYFDNPMLITAAPVQAAEQWEDWSALCAAWWAGWMRADGGRDPAICALGSLRYR